MIQKFLIASPILLMQLSDYYRYALWSDVNVNKTGKHKKIHEIIIKFISSTIFSLSEYGIQP
jgi:hypothetical protein